MQRADPVGERDDRRRPDSSTAQGKPVAQQEQRPARPPARRPRRAARPGRGRGRCRRGVGVDRHAPLSGARVPASRSITACGVTSPIGLPVPSTTAKGLPAATIPAAKLAILASGATVPPCSAPSHGAHQAARRHHLGAVHVAGEFGDIVGRRVDHQFLGRADLDDLAVLHDGDAVGQPDRLVEIMGDEDDGLAAARSAAASARPASRAGSADRAPRTARRGTRSPA